MAGHHGQDGHHVMTTVFVPVKDFATIQGTCNPAVETQMYTGWKRKRRSALPRYVQVKKTFTKSFKYSFIKANFLTSKKKQQQQRKCLPHVLPWKAFGKGGFLLLKFWPVLIFREELASFQAGWYTNPLSRYNWDLIW